MRTARRPYRATHRPPNAASARGLRDALVALYGKAQPMAADEQAATLHRHALVPYSKRQGDLALVLPEPDPE